MPLRVRRESLRRAQRTIREKLVNVAYVLSARLAPYGISVSDTRVHIDENGAARVIGSAARTPLEVWSYAGAATVLLVGTIAGVLHRRGLATRCCGPLCLCSLRSTRGTCPRRDTCRRCCS